jgi:CRISPR/Cas system-associated exonuclease Cas4 (RecB family)
MQLEFWGEEKEQPESAAQSKRASSRVIRASEIGEYVYCHRAWWLGRVKGVPNANRAQLDAGIVRHRAHGQSVQRADSLQRAAWVLILIAVVIAISLAVMVFGVR